MTRVSRPDPLEHVGGLHRPDRDAADDPVEVRARDGPSRRGRPRGSSPGSGSTGSADTAARRAAGSRGGRARARVSGRCPGWASSSTLLTIAPATRRRGPAKSDALRTISSIGRPTPPSETMIAGAPSMAATVAFDRPITAPTPAWPVPSISRISRSANAAWAARIRAPRSSTISPAMYALVKPRGMWTGLIDGIGSVRPKTCLHEDRVLVGRHPVLDDRPLADRLHEAGCRGPRRRKPSRSPRLVVVLPRFWPVAAR